VWQNCCGLALQTSNRPGIDVAVDTEIDPDAEVEHEAGFVSRLRVDVRSACE